MSVEPQEPCEVAAAMISPEDDGQLREAAVDVVHATGDVLGPTRVSRLVEALKGALRHAYGLGVLAERKRRGP